MKIIKNFLLAIICIYSVSLLYACAERVVDPNFYEYKNRSIITISDLVNIMTYPDNMDTSKQQNKSLYLSRKEFYLSVGNKTNKYEMPVISTPSKPSNNLIVLTFDPKMPEDKIISYLNQYGFSTQKLDFYSNNYITPEMYNYLVKKPGYNKSVISFHKNRVICTLYN